MQENIQHSTKPIAVSVKNMTKLFNIDIEQKNTLKSKFVNPFKKSEVRKFTALEDITFDVQDGDFFGVIGRNGSGKSTLLKLIAGVYAPTSGSIITDGHIVPFLELGVGFNPELTALENVYLNGILLGMTQKDVDCKLDSIFAFAELDEFRQMQVKYYSSGMMVRLAFSIAMQIDGDIFIMDEVLAVGDANFQKKCITRLEELVASKKTILFVTHDISTVQKYCNKVAYIKDHKLHAVGDTASITQMYIDDLSKI